MMPQDDRAPSVSDPIDFLVDAGRRWDNACQMAELLAVNPRGLKGIILEGGASPARDRWLDRYASMAEGEVVTLPAMADEERVLGGLDLARTLVRGEPCHSTGLLGRAHGGTVLVRMASRLHPPVIHALSTALDERKIRVERDGLSRVDEALFAVVLLSDGDGDEGVAGSLEDRLAFLVRLDGIPLACLEDEPFDPRRLAAARARLSSVSISEDRLEALGTACLSVGVMSLRPQLFCVEAAMALAAIAGRDEVDDEDIKTAARLVLAPRARPRSEEPGEQEASSDDEAPGDEGEPDDSPAPGEGLDEEEMQAGEDDAELAESIAEAVQSGAVSMAMLAAERDRQRRRAAAAGRAGMTTPSRQGGRPVGAEPGDPRRGGRLDVLATLRAAAPWQKLRPAPAAGNPVRILPSDLRIRKYAHRAGSSVIFVVDASGSSAMHRLAEAKGAVEALLAECYSRRDMVSVITFRGYEAERPLPPSRSLTRARRALAGLPGGGGTPLPSAMQIALRTALAERDEGRTPIIVFLSDGQGNVALNGEPGRRSANADVERLAKLLAEAPAEILFFDTSPRPMARVQSLAATMGARYTPLPYADQTLVSDTVGAERDAIKRAGRR